MTDLSDVAQVVRGYRFVYASEEELQRGIAGALEREGYTVEYEAHLNARDRIDLLIGRVGVEVKIAGSAAEVARQVDRYLASDLIDGLVLVTGRARHTLLDAHPRVEVVTLLGNL